MIYRILGITLAILLVTSSAFAHCDSVNGPVIVEARTALEAGDVTPLLRAIDDRLVIMGSGDEIALTFPAARLPALPRGWTRDFLLLVDGWAKDADPNTAFSQSVEPLPFQPALSDPGATSPL